MVNLATQQLLGKKTGSVTLVIDFLSSVLHLKPSLSLVGSFYEEGHANVYVIINISISYWMNEPG